MTTESSPRTITLRRWRGADRSSLTMTRAMNWPGMAYNAMAKAQVGSIPPGGTSSATISPSRNFGAILSSSARSFGSRLDQAIHRTSPRASRRSGCRARRTARRDAVSPTRTARSAVRSRSTLVSGNHPSQRALDARCFTQERYVFGASNLFRIFQALIAFALEAPCSAAKKSLRKLMYRTCGICANGFSV